MRETQKERIMKTAYENGTEYKFTSREERNAWLDYRRARNAGKDHEEAMNEIRSLAAKFAPTAKGEKPESETDRRYRELRESTARSTVVYRDIQENPNGISTEEALRILKEE
jgi:hypothetical protein